MANEGTAIIIILINAIALVAVLAWIIWSERSKARRKTSTNTRLSRQRNIVLSSVPSTSTQRSTITLINPTNQTGEVTIHNQKRVLHTGPNKITVPTADELNIGWQLRNGPIRQATILPQSGYVYVILNDGIFRRGDWSSKTPVVTIPLNYQSDQSSTTGVSLRAVKSQMGYNIQPRTITTSSVNVNNGDIHNAYTGLPLRIQFERNANKVEKDVTIDSPGQPLYLIENLSVSDGREIVVPSATQNVVTITANYTPSGGFLYLQTSPIRGRAGNVYRLYPGVNYFDEDNPNNKWFLLMSSGGSPLGSWVPVNSYTTFGNKLN